MCCALLTAIVRKFFHLAFLKPLQNDLYLKKYNTEGEDRRRKGHFLTFTSAVIVVVLLLQLTKRKMLQ